MQRWASPQEVPAGFGPSTVTIGVFDGVHRGHRVVVGRAVDQARADRSASVVITFDPHPIGVVRPTVKPVALSTLDHRLQLLAELGVDACLVLHFDRERAAQSAADFAREVLAEVLGAATVVVGADFRFGHRAAGDVALLERLGAVLGFSVAPVPLAGGPTRWSSTAVRAMVAAGDMAGAAEVLGRPHRLEGPVVRGDQRGRTIGYPTANLALAPDAAIPADGIYAGWLTHRDGPLPAAISIGTNPTFDGRDRRVEAYVLDRDDLELYDEHVALDFLVRLRDTLRFDSVADLVAQMGRDCDRARALLT